MKNIVISNYIHFSNFDICEIKIIYFFKKGGILINHFNLIFIFSLLCFKLNYLENLYHIYLLDILSKVRNLK